jgi:hypothetical protein
MNLGTGTCFCLRGFGFVTGFGFVYELAGARSLFGEGGSVAGPERGPWRGPVASVVSSGPSGDGYKEEERPRRLSLNQRCYYLLQVSSSGYSNDQLSLDWLHYFEKHTRKLTKGAKRLLLLDGYRSHHTIEFIQYCDNNNIIPFGFPPHTTHILQPLDVVVFQPYKHYHTKALNVAVRDGCTRFNKVESLSAIGEIRRQTFKESTIKFAFRKTGIVPFKPSVVLSPFPSQESSAESEPTTPSRSSTGGRHTGNPDILKTTPLTIRSLKRQSEFLYENAPQDDPEFTEVLDKFIRGSVLHSTERLQSMRDLSRTRLAEQMRSERARYNTSRRSLQTGGILTMEDGRQMVRQTEDDERAKAERLLRRLEEKDSKMRKKWVEAAAKMARAWRKGGKLKPLYIVDALGKGRELVRG